MAETTASAFVRADAPLKGLSMHIAELWRYPVASLAGEPLTHARLDEGGVSGDRRFSIVCKTTGTVASPESAAHWQGAPLVAARGSGLDLCIKTPSTDWLPAFGVAAASALNEHFGFEVEIRTTGRWRGEPPQSKRIQPRYNRQPLHLITTRSLNLLAEALPSEPVNAQRFRANLVLDMSQDEESEMMREGTAVSFGRPDIRILGPTGRCAFVALAQNKLAGAPKLLRQIKQEHDMNFGFYASVEATGHVSLGSQTRGSTCEPSRRNSHA